MTRNEPKRLLARFDTAEFKPMHTFGGADGEILWHNLSFDVLTGVGSYLLEMHPGSSSSAHRHSGAEEFYVLEGELVDFDGHVYRAGDFVRLAAGTAHMSLSPSGCKLLVTHWGRTEPVGIAELEPLS